MGSHCDMVSKSPSLGIFTTRHDRCGCLLLKISLRLQSMKCLIDLRVKLKECFKIGGLVPETKGNI